MDPTSATQIALWTPMSDDEEGEPEDERIRSSVEANKTFKQAAASMAASMAAAAAASIALAVATSSSTLSQASMSCGDLLSSRLQQGHGQSLLGSSYQHQQQQQQHQQHQQHQQQLQQQLQQQQQVFSSSDLDDDDSLSLVDDCPPIGANCQQAELSSDEGPIEDLDSDIDEARPAASPLNLSMDTQQAEKLKCHRSRVQPKQVQAHPKATNCNNPNSQRKAITHSKSNHSSATTTTTNQNHSTSKQKRLYKCRHCPFETDKKCENWQHIRIHMRPEKLLACESCQFVTEYKHHLEYHQRNHSGFKPFKCANCDYQCVNKSMLNSHMKSHSSIYQYQCGDCKYATKYVHSLKMHLRKYNHQPAHAMIDVYGRKRGPKSNSSSSTTSSNAPNAPQAASNARPATTSSRHQQQLESEHKNSLGILDLRVDSKLH